MEAATERAVWSYLWGKRWRILTMTILLVGAVFIYIGVSGLIRHGQVSYGLADKTVRSGELLGVKIKARGFDTFDLKASDGNVVTYYGAYGVIGERLRSKIGTRLTVWSHPVVSLMGSRESVVQIQANDGMIIDFEDRKRRRSRIATFTYIFNSAFILLGVALILLLRRAGKRRLLAQERRPSPQ